MNLSWFFVFFLVSGFCSLIYDVVWLRLAMAKFGVTTPMVPSCYLSSWLDWHWAPGLAEGSFAASSVMEARLCFGSIVRPKCLSAFLVC